VRVSADTGARQSWIGLGVDFRTDEADPGAVVGLAENGPALKAGLRLGDRIVTLGGARPTPADQEAMAKVASCGCRETIPVTFEREGVVNQLSVTTEATI
jgi:predicted metalloprotease with PDZ domain